jgi:acyl-CoA hydrolase
MSASIRQGRPVRESRSQYTQVTLPNDANNLGNVLGGYIMHLVAMCGGLAAWRHAQGPVVTAAVDQMSFLSPVRVGEVLILKSSVNRVFHSSMEVGVKVWVEDRTRRKIRHASSAYLTFVALDENDDPLQSNRQFRKPTKTNDAAKRQVPDVNVDYSSARTSETRQR